MRFARPALCLALVATMAAAGAASAATKPKPKPPAPPVPITITDPAGDANAFNDQGEPAPIPSQVTPADDSAGDIVSVTWTSLVTVQKVGTALVNVPAGMQVKMTLSAPPQMNTIYRVTTATADCTTFWLNYSSLVGGSPSATLQHDCPGFTPSGTTGSSESDPVTSFKVDGNSLIWTLPSSMLPKVIKKGTHLTGLSAHTRFYAGTSATGGATVPAIDEAAGGGDYTYGK